MKKLNFLFAIVFCAVAASGFSAEDSKNPPLSNTPFDRCDWPNVHMQVHFDIVTKQGDKVRGAQFTEQINEVIKLSNSVKAKDKSVFSQLSSVDQVRFKSLTKSINLKSAENGIQNKLMRDLDIIDHLIKVADKEYRWYDTYFDDKNPEKIYRDILDVLPALNEGNGFDISTPPNLICSLDVALFRIEAEPIGKLNKLSETVNLANVQSTLKNLTIKYNVQSLDRAKLSAADQKIYDDLENKAIRPLTHEQTYINQMESLRLLYAASDLSYQSALEDLKTGDYSKVGVTLAAKLQNNQLSPLMTRTVLAWNILHEKMPKPDWPQDPGFIN